MVGKGIGLDIPRARAVGEVGVEPSLEQGPPSLVRVQPVGGTNVR